MKVKEIIELLQKENPEANISVWDAYYDKESTEVFISHIEDNVHIGDTDFGS
jgi:hypothetical protein